MYTRTTLATVALPLNLRATTRTTGAANINAMFPHYTGYHSAALENPRVRHASAIHELGGGTVQALAENLAQRFGRHSFGHHADTLGFGIEPPGLPASRETLTAAAVRATPAATASVRFEPLPG